MNKKKRILPPYQGNLAGPRVIKNKTINFLFVRRKQKKVVLLTEIQNAGGKLRLLLTLDGEKQKPFLKTKWEGESFVFQQIL